nr:dipeptidase PepV [Bacillus sp. 03113]
MWLDEVEKRKNLLLQDTQKLLQIKSILDEENATEDAPLGKGVKEALLFMLDLGQKDGFTVKNVGNLAGHIEFGSGEECIGILCHVDVVPEGKGWSTDPFGAEISDGKIFARGALDDKGPTMAAYYAMKIVKELELPINKRIRMIIGTDEESEWRCIEHYFQHEEMPTIGFAPDADFPIINAEKGIANFDVVQQKTASASLVDAELEVISFTAGRRYNMVPDEAEVSLIIKKNQSDLIKQFEDFLTEFNLEGHYFSNNEELIFVLKGKSAHGMQPEQGINAGIYLAEFLSKRNIDDQAKHYLQFVTTYFFNDTKGISLNLAYSDDTTGDVTINAGLLSYTNKEGGKLGLNLRYPVTYQMEERKMELEKFLLKKEFIITNFSNSKPHYVGEDDFLIKTLRRVYKEQTNDNPELLAIGGATYARTLKSGVAFGPLFPGREDIAHQKDEYMYVEDILRATAIYAQAIFELAK